MKPQATQTIVKTVEELGTLLNGLPWLQRAERLSPSSAAMLDAVWDEMEFGLGIRRDIVPSAMARLGSLLKPSMAFWRRGWLGSREGYTLAEVLVRFGYKLAAYVNLRSGDPPHEASADERRDVVLRLASLLDAYDAHIRGLCLELTRLVAGPAPVQALASQAEPAAPILVQAAAQEQALAPALAEGKGRIASAA